MKLNCLIISLLFVICAAWPVKGQEENDVVVGAARVDQYEPILRGKRIGLLSNHTGTVGERHVLDIMLENNLNVATIFSPEHGFRGSADAGEHVSSSVDPITGISITSLYGPGSADRMKQAMGGIDVIVCDIQDVGLRFYTYYCTMLQLMNAAAENGKEFVVFDRPNPNGMYVDGPILDMKYESGVGRLPIPVVHGMTLGELAQMILGEHWLKDNRSLHLTVIPCLNYTHATRYRLPVAPSPNLRTMRAIYFYPSICLFEGTVASLGRGTEMPFEVYGHPDYRGGEFTFTPQSVPGAKNPPLLGQLCHGVDLRTIDEEAAIAGGLDLTYIIDAYNRVGMGDKFFTSFFEKLIGRAEIRQMIEQGLSAEQIRATWAEDVEQFKNQRRPYLLYAE